MGYTISSGETSTGITLYSDYDMAVLDGGTANSTAVNFLGRMYVSSGGTANSTTVNSSGSMFVWSGGTANRTTVKSGGYMDVLDGNASDITVSAGGILGGFSWQKDQHCDTIANGSAIITDHVFIVGNHLYVEAPGAAKAQNSHYTAVMTEVGTFANLGNETWDDATVLETGIDGLLSTAAGGDRYDYFDLSGNGGTPLELGMTAGKVTVSFYNAQKKAVKTAVEYANGKTATLGSVTLAAGNAMTGSIALGALDDSIRYMKIEAATAGINTYSLALTA